MRSHISDSMEASLGKTLRAAREASDITVDDAVYRGKLPRAVVHALEADDFGFFTSPLYARSFLKQYGEFVGVDTSPWMDDLVPTTLIDSEAVEAFIDLYGSDPVPKIKEKQKPKKTGGGSMAAVWMVLITGGLIWGVIEAMKRMDEKLAPSPPTQQQQPEQPRPAIAETPPAAPEIVPPAIREPETPKRAIIVEIPEE
jgi:cytoskeletal protein RodZ